ncbi:MAG TPA: response regulator [Anaerolineales bacterium]|nr:response regulator [Anaerolineales bacterium]
MVPPPPRVYVIDEHGPVRRALADRLSRQGSVTVVGDSAEAAQALESIRQGEVDIVLIEIKRSDGMGLEWVRQISSRPESPKVIVLTTYPSDWEEAAARRAGAAAYVLKDLDAQELLQHILAAPG